jgi:hypothetical protein
MLCYLLEGIRVQKTKAELRFRPFVEKIKTAKTDIDIALAGWDLVEEYMGFRTRKCARQSLTIIDNIFKKEEQNETS